MWLYVATVLTIGIYIAFGLRVHAATSAVPSYQIAGYENFIQRQAVDLWDTKVDIVQDGEIFASEPPLSQDRLITLFAIGDGRQRRQS